MYSLHCLSVLCDIPVSLFLYRLLLAPSRAPQNATVKNKASHDRLEVSWNSVPLEFVHGDLKGYKVFYTLASTGGKIISPVKKREVKTHPYERKAVLKNLVPNSVYKLQILAINEHGEGIKSKAISGGKSFFKIQLLYDFNQTLTM